MAARDPIASNIGHGQFGLRSGLRTFDTLVQQSRSQKHAFVEIRGGKLAVPASWSVHSGSVYKITTFEVFDGRRLDVVGVRLARTTLTRVEALADVVAGTYYVDPTPSVATILYARLSDSSNPASSQIMLLFGFYFGSTRAVQPTLGPDKLTDGALDVWTSSTSPTNWALSTSGATVASVNKDLSVVAQGSYSARIDVGSLIPGGFVSLSNDAAAMPTVAGAMYRLAFSYREASNAGGLCAGVGLQAIGAGAGIYDDGRSLNLSTSQRLTLLPARDEWKSAIFDFVAPSTTLYTRLYALCPTGGGTGGGKVWFDGLTLKRIYRWELHEGRMSYEALPTINEGRSGIFFDRWTIGQGSVSLVNGNDYFENLFGTYEVANAEARILLGGRFPDGGNEILTGDMMVRRWTARKPTVSDSEAHLDLDDPRQILLEVLPKRRDELPDWPDMAPVDNGRPVPMIFGAVPVQIGHPARVGVTSDGYGIYHVLDERYLVNMTSMISGVYSFTSEEAADKNVLTERISNSQWTYGVTTGLLTITGDIRPIRISRGVTDLIDAVVDGVAKVAKVDTYGLPSDSLATIKNHLAIRIQNALDDVGAGRTYTVSYSDTTHLVTIQQNAGTFVMSLTSAAPNRDRSLCPLIGFDENVDRTGGLTYTGESALFDDLDKQHIVRAAVFGYLDDTSGTYTGSAAAEISKPGDVLYFLLHKVLGVPVEQIDLASVAAVRSGADALRMYLGISREDEHEFGQIVEWIENSNGIQLLQDGDLWKLRKRASTLQATAATLYDRDFLSFDSWYDEADLASIVRIDYGQDPSTGEMPSYTVSDQTSGHVLGADVQLGRLRLGREKSMSFQTYLPDTASAWLPKMVYNAMARRRRFSFSVKGTCFRSGPEDQVVIARTTFAGRTTAAPTCLARILEVTRDPKTYVSTIQAVEILSGTYGW